MTTKLNGHQETIVLRGIRLLVEQTRQDRLGRKIWDVNAEDGHLWGTGYSRKQAIARATRKLA